MANRGAPTFVKRQKEQQRAARALAKRVAKQARRENRNAAAQSDETNDDELSSVPTEETPIPEDHTAD